jgi:hypothetical protein
VSSYLGQYVLASAGNCVSNVNPTQPLSKVRLELHDIKLVIWLLMRIFLHRG